MCVRTSSNVAVPLPKPMIKILDEQARKSMTTRSTVIRQLLARQLDYKPDHKPETA